MTNIRIIMLGTGTPRLSLERSQAAQVLLIDDLPILVDCGEGTTQQLMKAGIAPQTVNYLWLTHLHADHVLGYGQFLLGGWGAGRRKFTVVGPKGTKKFHQRILEMFEEDIDYKLRVGRPVNGLMDVNIIEVEEAGQVDCDLPAEVTAEFVIHDCITLAYRFQMDGKAVVFSGDTAPSHKLVQLSKGADVLVHDASVIIPKSQNNPGFQAIYENLKKVHSSPAQAGEAAHAAGVKTLVLTHLLSGIDTNEAFLEVSGSFSGKVIVAEDLQTILVD